MHYLTTPEDEVNPQCPVNYDEDLQEKTEDDGPRDPSEIWEESKFYPLAEIDVEHLSKDYCMKFGRSSENIRAYMMAC